MTRFAIGVLLCGWSALLSAQPTFFLDPKTSSINPQVITRGLREDFATAWNAKYAFTDQTFHQVGVVHTDNSVATFKLVDPSDPSNLVNPLSIDIGGDGNLWFTGYITNASGSPLNRSFLWNITPAGSITRYPLPTGNACTGFFGFPDCPIRFTPDGDHAWMLETEASKAAIVTLGGQITEFPVSAATRFYLGVVAASDGSAWATDRINGSILHFTSQGLETEFKIPGTNSAPWGIALGPDQNFWFTAGGINSIGKLTPDGGMTLFSCPTNSAQPSQLTVGPDQKIWFTETGARKIGQLDPSSGMITETSVPNGDVPFSIARVGSNQIVFNALNASGDWNVYIGSLAETHADMAISKKYANLSRGFGHEDAFCIEVNNVGMAVDNYIIEDQLPDSLEFTGFGSTSDNLSCQVIGHKITCQSKTALAPNSKNAVCFFFKQVGNNPIINTAVVTSPSDHNSLNDFATAPFPTRRRASNPPR